MRKLFVLGFAFGAVALTTTAIFGCGDKLTLLVGSARLRQVYSRAHPATYLAALDDAMELRLKGSAKRR